MRPLLKGGIAAAIVSVIGLSGCSGTAGAGSAHGSLKTIKGGVLTVGLSPDFPPMEYLDPTTNALTGVDIDIVNEVGKRLGLKVEYTQQKFDQLINSVRTNRVDVVFSGLSDTVERQKTLDFVDYFKSVGRFYTTSDKQAQFTKDTDVCGKPVAVASATDYYPALQAFSKKVCESASLPAINIIPTDSGAAARLQLDQGRAVLAVQGAENLVYFAKKTPGKYAMVLSDVNSTPYGAATQKGNKALEQKIVKAFQDMKADGTLKKILDANHVGYGLMDPIINGVK
ncbi:MULTISPECIES: ABC transporter substrate-binding protein [Streptomyces]|uniref:ABC transporter substrate-binding protein n=1 Tax=Streptomyces lycopersici TaxID=2974589 RepID=UPI0021D38898|nr:ABC transporter substrate-binding protein [Streptomyces sp. NEAU-383]